MKLVQVLKVHSYVYDGEQITPATTWTEVSDEEYEKLSEAVNYANYYGSTSSRGYGYVLLEKVEDFNEVFDDAKKWTESVEKRKKADEARKQKEAEKREATKLERKRRQLEKLKKELENES